MWCITVSQNSTQFSWKALHGWIHLPLQTSWSYFLILFSFFLNFGGSKGKTWNGCDTLHQNRQFFGCTDNWFQWQLMVNLNVHTFSYAEFCKHCSRPSATYHLKLHNQNKFISIVNIQTLPCLIHNDAFNLISVRTYI